MTIYDLAYILAAPAVAPYLAWKSIVSGKYRESAPAMLGMGLKKENPAQWRQGCVWVHAVSVGEVIAAKAMLPLLRGRFPGLPLLLTTVTETGQAQARQLGREYADAVRYYPVDFSWVVGRFLATYRPKVLVLMETELWPNALRVVSATGAKIFVVNGKISNKSYPNYVRLHRFVKGPLSQVSAFCMQTRLDAERAGFLCGDPSRVFVTGNCKFDVPMPVLTPGEKDALRRETGLVGSSPVVVVGSTHPGEEEIALNAFARCRTDFPEAVMLLAPRHPERFAEVWELVRTSGIAAGRMSQPPGESAASGSRIILVDRMGILSRLYGIADVAVVAGSFVKGIGGHNVLEAAVHGVPVVYGPYMDKQPDMVRILGESQAGMVATGEELGSALLNLLCNPRIASTQGRRGREVVLQNRGSSQRNMEIISRCLGEP